MPGRKPRMGRAIGAGKMTKRGYVPALLIAGTLGIGILIGTLISRGVRAARPGRPEARLLTTPSPGDLGSSFARVAESVDPAVVNIKTETDVQVDRRHPSTSDDNESQEGGAPFDGFFDHFFHFRGRSGSIPEASLGSGVVLDPSGFI